MNKTYTRFAEVYDAMEADEHSIRMVDYTKRLIRKFKIEASTCLDLCCGTGTALKLLADEGIMMSGLDGSAAMLAHAKKKLHGRPVHLYHQTLPKFRIANGNSKAGLRRFDLVTCFYDSLNYMLTQRDLQLALRAIYSHLNPGGWFIFDMNTEAALKVIWGEVVYSGVRDDLAWIWRNEFNETKKQPISMPRFLFVKEEHGSDSTNSIPSGLMITRLSSVY